MEYGDILDQLYPSEWRQLTPAEMKAVIEHNLDKALAVFKEKGPNEIQRHLLRSAIVHTEHGLYWMAMTNLAHALQPDVYSKNYWQNPAGKPTDLDTLTLERLGDGVSWLKLQPAKQYPEFRW